MVAAAYAIGVDQSADHTGVCALDAQGFVLVSEVLEPDTDGIDRLVAVRNMLRDALTPVCFEPPAIAMWESYSYGSTNRKFLLGEIGGIIQVVLHDLGVARIDCAAPQQLKKFVTSDARAEKIDVMRAIYQRWGVVFTDDNKADAYGLAQLGRHLLAPNMSTVRAKRDVVSKINRRYK